MPLCFRRGDGSAPILRTNGWLESQKRHKTSGFGPRAEAAILEAKGDVDGAMKKLAETETAILAIPKSAQRETLLQLLQRWKSDLCRC
jgi:hypothetical protein